MVARWLTASVLLGLLVTLSACSLSKPVAPAPAGAEDEEPPGPDVFEDITAQSGVNFTYRNGEESAPRNLTILESLGGGAALIDFDGDGLLDLFLPGGGTFAGNPDARGLKREIVGCPCRLYKNLGKGKFKDVTAEVGLDKLAGGAPWFYTHGAAVADYDRDGWPDLLVTGWGRCALFKNVPDGKGGRRFADVTAQAGLDKGITWTTSAAFADLDGDGYPDLYMCQYVDWSWDKHPPCTYDGKTPDVCPPRSFFGLRHKLFHNTGKGTFIDVSATVPVKKAAKDHAGKELPTAGLMPAGAPKESETGKGLGVIIVDIDGDRKPDIYVANDTVDNFLYHNTSTPGKLSFEEVGLSAGVARDDRGTPQGSMGLDAGDPVRGGKPFLWVTNYENEQHALYENVCRPGKCDFNWHTGFAGIAALSQVFVGWGTAFIDVDLDGWEDIFISNGHAIRNPTGRGVTRRQKPMLLLNEKGRFTKINKRLGDYGTKEHLGRGVAFGDLDNDGRIDMALAPTNEPVAILRGIGGQGRHWLGVQLEGKDHADYVGAKVVLEMPDGKQTRFAKGGGSYASANDRRLVFGLAEETKIKGLEVTWPDGTKQRFDGLAVDRYHVLVQGDAKARAYPLVRK
jgi:hypothetical protein